MLLFTGGLDSLMAWRLAGEPECLYLHQPGNPYADQEVEAIGRLMRRLPDLQVRVAPGPPQPPVEADGHVQHRNLSLIVAAAQYSDVVMIGALKGETSPDKSRSFMRSAEAVLSKSERRQVTVLAPLKNKTKAQALRRHLKRWPLDQEALRDTYSCYEGDECGQCQACFRRWVALYLNGVEWWTDWKSPPWIRKTTTADLTYLTRTGEWYGVGVNNIEAWKAMRRKRREVAGQ